MYGFPLTLGVDGGTVLYVTRGRISRERLLEQARERRERDPQLWTYERLGEFLDMSAMGAYYALNPEKRISIAEREDGLRQHSILLSDSEWATVGARARESRCSRAAAMRDVLFGTTPPLTLAGRDGSEDR